MRRRAWLGVILGIAALAAGVLGAVAASGGGVKRVSYAVAAFNPVTESTHNNNGDSVCAAGFVASEPPSENKGDLNAKKGSFLQEVLLPQGAQVRQLSLFVNDNDGDDGTYVFLVRKQITDGLSPQFTGYKVMATTQSDGAVLNTMREFTDDTVSGAKIDNNRFDYYLELVNCATVEPFAVQITYAP